MKNIFAKLPSRPQADEIIDTLLQNSRFCLKRIISTGQSTPVEEWYDQEEDEWCILLTGAAALRFEGQTGLIELQPGDYIHIPAHQKHQVAWTQPGAASVWLALHYQADEEA